VHLLALQLRLFGARKECFPKFHNSVTSRLDSTLIETTTSVRAPCENNLDATQLVYKRY
jgi:hypothetical protein